MLKVPKYGVFYGPYLPEFSPNRGKYVPEKTPYLDTFHAVLYCRISQVLEESTHEMPWNWELFPKPEKSRNHACISECTAVPEKGSDIYLPKQTISLQFL